MKRYSQEVRYQESPGYLHMALNAKSSIGSDLNLQSLLDAINYKAAA